MKARLSSGSELTWHFHEKRDPTFEFLEEPHEYVLQSRRLWSATGVISFVGWADGQEYYRPEHLIRGSNVHILTHHEDNGTLESSFVDDAYIGYLMAYQEFKRVWNFVPRVMETPMYHPQHFYGVTPDREGLILDGDAAIIELKSGVMPWWTKYQTAAQDMAINAWEPVPTFRRRVGVQLSKDGKFKAEEFTDPDDYDGFLEALRTCQRKGEPKRKIVEAAPIGFSII